jgi:hypothetical protein
MAAELTARTDNLRLEVEGLGLTHRSGDPGARRIVAEAIDRLLDDGPALGRPLADRITGSRLHNLKELRPGSSGTRELRILAAQGSGQG